MNNITATEINIIEQNNEYYIRLKKHLAVVLDYVERWNKNDSEYEVAKSAQWLSELLTPSKK